VGLKKRAIQIEKRKKKQLSRENGWFPSKKIGGPFGFPGGKKGAVKKLLVGDSHPERRRIH